jgi:hypothetical protein
MPTNESDARTSHDSKLRWRPALWSPANLRRGQGITIRTLLMTEDQVPTRAARDSVSSNCRQGKQSRRHRAKDWTIHASRTLR